MTKRFHKSTTHYPAYNHTSYNAEWRGKRLTFEASLHIKHALAGGGFWFGLRPEFTIHRVTDKMMETLEWARQARSLQRCDSCGTEEWGEPGLGLPEGWEYVSGPYTKACTKCVSTKTLAELKAY